MTQDIASNRILGAIALVPEFAKLTNFTGVALISGVILAAWHSPLWRCAPVIFGRIRVSIPTHTQPPFKGMGS